MNKKIIAVLALLILVGSASVFATGIGAQAGSVAGKTAGALTFKLNKSPYVFALNLKDIGADTEVGISMDNWLANKTFASPFAYYYGYGFAGGISTGSNTISAGLRLVGGVNVFIAKVFEFYAQVAWQPTLEITSGVGFEFGYFPVNVGFRFWF